MADWTKVGTTDDFGDDSVFGVIVGGKRIAIYSVDGAVYATDDMCSHGQASLSEGWLEDGLIECPLHQGLFDVRTGEPKGAPCTLPIATYPAKLEGTDVFVQIVA
ncbi:MAG: non-heme iron oxygenase ferredoxin subunit [Pseudomonadota bacterium]